MFFSKRETIVSGVLVLFKTVTVILSASGFFLPLAQSNHENQRYLSLEEASCYIVGLDWENITAASGQPPSRYSNKVIYKLTGGILGDCKDKFRITNTGPSGGLKAFPSEIKSTLEHGFAVESLGGIECVQEYFEKLIPGTPAAGHSPPTAPAAGAVAAPASLSSVNATGSGEPREICPPKVKNGLRCGGNRSRDKCVYLSGLPGSTLHLEIEENARISFLEPRGGDPAKEAMNVAKWPFPRPIDDYVGASEKREQRRKEQLERNRIEARNQAEIDKRREKFLRDQIKHCRGEEHRSIVDAALLELERDFGLSERERNKIEISWNQEDFKKVIDRIENLSGDELTEADEIAETLEEIKNKLPKGKNNEEKVAEAYVDLAKKLVDPENEPKARNYVAAKKLLNAALKLKSTLKAQIKNEIIPLLPLLELENRARKAKHPGALYASYRKLGRATLKEYQAACRGRLKDTIECEYATERKESFKRAYYSDFIPTVKADGAQMIREALAERVALHRSHIQQQQQYARSLINLRMQSVYQAPLAQNPLLWNPAFLAGSNGLFQDPSLYAGINGIAGLGGHSGSLGGLYGGGENDDFTNDFGGLGLGFGGAGGSVLDFGYAGLGAGGGNLGPGSQFF